MTAPSSRPVRAARASVRAARGRDGRPTDDELAAIVAAIEAAWPRPVVVEPPAPAPARWRFAGRWWTKPVPARRDRPW